MSVRMKLGRKNSGRESLRGPRLSRRAKDRFSRMQGKAKTMPRNPRAMAPVPADDRQVSTGQAVPKNRASPDGRAEGRRMLPGSHTPRGEMPTEMAVEQAILAQHATKGEPQKESKALRGRLIPAARSADSRYCKPRNRSSPGRHPLIPSCSHRCDRHSRRAWESR